MGKHNKIFYLILFFIIVLVSVLIYVLLVDPAYLVIAFVLFGMNILLLFQLFYLQEKFLKLETEAETAMKKLKNEMEEECIKKTEDLKIRYRQSKHIENQLRETTESAIQGFAILSLDGNFLKVNSALGDIIGYTEDELLKTNLQEITHPDDYNFDMLNFKNLISGKSTSFKAEKRLYHSGGITTWVIQNMRLIKSLDDTPMHFIAHYIDITERKQAEDQLKKYTETLTVLLREVNHRVKNNLAALISMIHMEQHKAEITHNKSYDSFLRDLISRIQSLSTVHSMLSAQNWQPLELSQLCNQVIQAAIYGTPPDKKVMIRVTPTHIKVNSNQAHHLTLVINELTTNSIKHAINERDQALITVEISSKEGQIHIRFKDDGPGFPNSMLNGDFSMSNIGFELIRGIVQQSLDGEFKLENDHGAVANIIFQNELEAS